MLWKKRLCTMAMAAMLVGAVGASQAGDVQHQSVLNGKVVTVIAVGTPVQEGASLMTVETLAGPMTASRATVAGVVTAVEVQPGQTVQRGQDVAIVDTDKK